MFRPCRQCPGRAGSVPAVPAVSRSYDCVPDTLAESWLCRQYPGVCPLNVTHCLLFPVETKFFGRSSSPVLHTPFVTLLSILVTGTNCNELGVIWSISHKILKIITQSCIIIQTTNPVSAGNVIYVLHYYIYGLLAY